MVEVDVYSPSTDSGLDVSVSPYSSHKREISAGQLSKLPLAAKFVDLPEAIAVARQNGMHAPFQKAMLLNWGRWGSVWEIDAGPPNSVTTGLYRVLSSGHIVPPGTGPMSDYVAKYNDQWNRAVAGLQNLLGQGSHHRCYEGFWDPGFQGCLLPPGAISGPGAFQYE